MHSRHRRSEVSGAAAATRAATLTPHSLARREHRPQRASGSPQQQRRRRNSTAVALACPCLLGTPRRHRRPRGGGDTHARSRSLGASGGTVRAAAAEQQQLPSPTACRLVPPLLARRLHRTFNIEVDIEDAQPLTARLAELHVAPVGLWCSVRVIRWRSNATTPRRAMGLCRLCRALYVTPWCPASPASVHV